MKRELIVGCSTSGIVDFAHPRQGVCDLVEAQFYEILLDLDASINKFTHDSARIEPVISEIKSNRLNVNVVRAPYYHRECHYQDLNDYLRIRVVEAVNVAKEINAKYIILDSLQYGIAEDDIWPTNRDFMLAIYEIVVNSDVNILIRNTCKDIGGHWVRGNCCESEEINGWIDNLNSLTASDRFGFCLDVGVANLCGQRLDELVKETGNRLKVVLLRDNNGYDDSALIPFTCANKGRSSTNWKSLIRGLRDNGFNGMMYVDIRDSSTAISPLLRPALLKMTREIMDFLTWQIDLENTLMSYSSRVLFGAGKMCINYMNSFGEQYPPLFTCDNNSKIWGSTVAGLEVHAPQDLLDLPSETAIFICNSFYREIELQLRGMGLRNPIIYFNDEYIPHI